MARYRQTVAHCHFEDLQCFDSRDLRWTKGGSIVWRFLLKSCITNSAHLISAVEWKVIEFGPSFHIVEFFFPSADVLWRNNDIHVISVLKKKVIRVNVFQVRRIGHVACRADGGALNKTCWNLLQLRGNLVISSTLCTCTEEVDHPIIDVVRHVQRG